VDARTAELRAHAGSTPNCDDPAGRRRPGVVHGINLPPGSSAVRDDTLFTNTLPADAHEYFAGLRSLKVSAHALIRRNGEVVQYVDLNRRAWHAGQSHWRGRANCNDFSIGFELEGTDTIPYETAQYVVLARLIAACCRAYATLTPDQVTGHSDVAPGRKSDPGIAFDWPLLRALLRFELEVTPR
jgi:AmpD protein